MQYAPPYTPPALREIAARINAPRAEGFAQGMRRGDQFDVDRKVISGSLVVGETSYPLRSALLGKFTHGTAWQQGEFSVPELFPEFIGIGWTYEDAFQDWRDQIHCRFQMLVAKRPFEMTESERATWLLLQDQIDVTAYRDATQLTIRQIGKVDQTRPDPIRIAWEDGRKERIRLDQMPGAFASYKAGQPFEAVVIRDPVDYRLLRVVHLQKRKATPVLGAGEIDSLLHSIPTAESLPDADWD